MIYCQTYSNVTDLTKQKKTIFICSSETESQHANVFYTAFLRYNVPDKMSHDFYHHMNEFRTCN